MQQFIVFARLTIFYLTLFGAFSFCYSAEEVTESSKTEEKQEADKPKSAGDLGKSATVPNASDEPVVTKHSITVGDSELVYSAETGMLPLLKEDGTAKASMFYVAYTIDGGDSSRPIIYCFNGGPGASAVWLHLGGLGPMRAQVNTTPSTLKIQP